MRLVIYFLILLAAILLGLSLKVGSGYVLIAYHYWTIEMPLWFAILAVLLAFISLHYFIRFWMGLGNIKSRWRAWKVKKHFHKAHSLTGRGLLELAEGYWVNAEKFLIKGVKQSSIPVINYLGAARAAQELHATDRRDEYIVLAHECAPEEEVGISLTRAELQIEDNQFESALAILRRLQDLVPSHPYVLKLLKRLYVLLNDWENLVQLLPQLKKQQVLEGEAYEQFGFEVYSHLLKQYKDNLEKLQEIWSGLPRYLQNNAELLAEYCEILLPLKQDEQIASLIERQLKKNWDYNLVKLYGLVKASNLNKQLKIAEGWLKQKHHQDSSIILLALGRIAARLQLWDKAEGYLNKCLEFGDDVEVYAALGYVYEQQGQEEKALKAYSLASRI